MNHITFLESLGACDEAIAFAKQFDNLQTAWQHCNRPDWMFWLLGRIDHQDDMAYRLIACWFVRNTPLNDGRVVWDLLTDKRGRNMVEVAERFAIGEATEDELDAASAAARAAAITAIGEAGAAAWAAASAAAIAAWAAALETARAAAIAAWAAAGAVAWAAAWAAQADHLREVFPWEVVEQAIRNYESEVL